MTCCTRPRRSIITPTCRPATALATKSCTSGRAWRDDPSNEAQIDSPPAPLLWGSAKPKGRGLADPHNRGRARDRAACEGLGRLGRRTRTPPVPSLPACRGQLVERVQGLLQVPVGLGLVVDPQLLDQGFGGRPHLATSAGQVDVLTSLLEGRPLGGIGSGPLGRKTFSLGLLRRQALGFKTLPLACPSPPRRQPLASAAPRLPHGLQTLSLRPVPQPTARPADALPRPARPPGARFGLFGSRRSASRSAWHAPRLGVRLRTLSL